MTEDDLAPRYDTTELLSLLCYMGANSRLRIDYTCGREPQSLWIAALLYAWRPLSSNWSVGLGAEPLLFEAVLGL